MTETTDTPKNPQKASSWSPSTICSPSPETPETDAAWESFGGNDGLWEGRDFARNLEIERDEARRSPLAIPQKVTAGWLLMQSIQAEKNAEALVDQGYHCAADSWFQLATAYRSESEIHFPANDQVQ